MFIIFFIIPLCAYLVAYLTARPLPRTSRIIGFAVAGLIIAFGVLILMLGNIDEFFLPTPEIFE